MSQPPSKLPLVDRLKRPIHDLRLSVTDRCNFRCVYCMPREVFGPGYQFLARSELLSFEEIERVARVFAGLGVKKLRITGGEPMVRRDLEHLVALLSAIPGIQDTSMTTNASLLTLERAESLRKAGLRRLNISLDALDDETFKRINDVDFPVTRVLEGIEAAIAAGFESVKVNMVVRRGYNEHSIVPMADHFRGSGCILRFIEFMDVGNSNGWNMAEVISAQEIVDEIHRTFPLEPVDPNYTGEVARRLRYTDGQGEIGVITSVTEPFCRDCARARLSAVGRLYTCLFASDGFDVKSLLRSGADDDALSNAVAGIWRTRADRYSEIRSELTRTPPRKIEMSYIGG
jgi:cyclic pyranopterin phosphate synthase